MEQQDLGGRPSAITEQVLAKLIEAFREGSTTAMSCSYAQIHPATFYRHMQSDEGFAREINSAKMYVSTLAVKAITNAIKNNNLQAAKWWLERNLPEEFGDKSEKHKGQYIFNIKDYERK